MTNSQFIIANFFKKIGILKIQKRLQNAATELQLLKEAEEILGRHVWANVKGIEQYKTNYLEINELLHDRIELSEKIQDIKDRIEHIKQSQESKFKSVNSPDIDIEKVQEKQKAVIDKIKSEIKDISDIAANIKKSYDNSLAKLKTITSAETDSDIAKEEAEKAKIEQLKNKFSELKDKKALSEKKLAKQVAILNKISNSMNSSKNSYKDEAIGNYEIMGKANQALSLYRSKIGVLDNKIVAHYKEIGHSISKECFTDNECRKAVKAKFKLCKIIQSLRQSIEYNHTLADR